MSILLPVPSGIAVGASGASGGASASASPTYSLVSTAFTLNPANGDVQSLLLTDAQNCIITPAGFPTSATIQPILLRVKQPASVTTGGTISFAAGWTNLAQPGAGIVIASPGVNDLTMLFFDQLTSTPTSGSISAANPALAVNVQDIVSNYTGPF